MVGRVQLHPIGLALQCPRELPDDRRVARLRGELRQRDGCVHEEPAAVPGVQLGERGRKLAEEQVVPLAVGNLEACDDLRARVRAPQGVRLRDEEGYEGSYSTVQRYVRRRREEMARLNSVRAQTPKSFIHGSERNACTFPKLGLD